MLIMAGWQYSTFSKVKQRKNYPGGMQVLRNGLSNTNCFDFEMVDYQARHVKHLKFEVKTQYFTEVSNSPLTAHPHGPQR